jgi:hypothetical protein
MQTCIASSSLTTSLSLTSSSSSSLGAIFKPSTKHPTLSGEHVEWHQNAL